MLSHCLFCRQSLPSNDALEFFPVGRRVAFDPERGRLWAVCPACARWNLAPIEERWEALEELERSGRDRAKLLAHTDNIALLAAPGLEIVRVGRAQLREEAWWRYGMDLLHRRARANRIKVLDVALAITVGAPVLGILSRALAFADAGWAERKTCTRCGAPVGNRLMTPRAARRLILMRDASGDLALERECPRCAWKRERGVAVWDGRAARHILRMTLAYQNFGGADARQLGAAADRIEASGGPDGYLADLGRGRGQLGEFGRSRYQVAGLAFEIALNEDLERRLLQAQLEALEDEWRDAEELAAIVDRELTPPTSG